MGSGEVAARWAKQRDRSEPSIVAALRRIGATVVLSDHPDLIVGYRGRTFLIECKSKGGSLRDSQRELLAEWRGGPLEVVYTVERALALVSDTVTSTGQSTG